MVRINNFNGLITDYVIVQKISDYNFMKNDGTFGVENNDSCKIPIVTPFSNGYYTDISPIVTDLTECLIFLYDSDNNKKGSDHLYLDQNGNELEREIYIKLRYEIDSPESPVTENPRVVSTLTEHYDSLYVSNDEGQGVVGLIQSDFIIYVNNFNGSSTPVVTITETQWGYYTIIISGMDTAGYYQIIIKHEMYNPNGWEILLEARDDVTLGSSY